MISDTYTRASTNTKIRVKDSGQECPLYTNLVAFFAPTRASSRRRPFFRPGKVLVAPCCGGARSGLFHFVFYLVFQSGFGLIAIAIDFELGYQAVQLSGHLG